MELNGDIQTINIPELIKVNKYYQYVSSIKNYEDTLQKLFTNGKESSITNDPYTFVWKIDKELFPNFRDISLDIFGIDNELSYTLLNTPDIIVTGPFVRSFLVNHDNVDSSLVTIRKELYVFRCGNEKWEDIVDSEQLENFEDKKTEYVYQDYDKKICLVKKKYKNQSHVIIQHDYLKRVGWCNGSMYVSSMFLIELQKHLSLLNSHFKDPVLGVLYNPLEIYQTCDKDRTHPVRIIESVDYDELTKLSKKSLNRLYNSKTCMELCLDKLVVEEHPVLVNQLKQMIVYIGTFSNRRPAFLYAKLLEIDKHCPEVYDFLKSINNSYDISDTDITERIKTVDDINNCIIDYLVSKDSVDDLLDYLYYLKCKISKNIIELIIKHDAKNIAKTFIKNKLIDNHLLYYLIIMTENLDLIKLLDFEFSVDISLNYLKDILENGKVRSFYFLYDMEPNIINTQFEDGKNILHCIKPNGDYNNLTELVIKLKPDLLDLKDHNKETPVVYQARENPSILKIFLEYEFDYTLTDPERNTFLHHLCRTNNTAILKLSLKRCPELIDMPNKKSETPIIVCGKNSMETMFYVLKGMGANMDAKDAYGNTVYHYICANSMCLGMMVENTPNYFGLKPYDYCKVSPSYYNFV